MNQTLCRSIWRIITDEQGSQADPPRSVLREDVLPATALSVSELARLLNTTPEMWLNMQRAVDLWQERRRLANELASIEPVAA